MQEMDKTGHGRGRFSRSMMAILLSGIVLPLGVMPSLAVAQEFGSTSKVESVTQTWEEIGEGWVEFGNLPYIAHVTLILLISIILAAAIAYHPSTRRKASNITEFEQPKTFLMYAMVGALIAQLVQTNSSMALVIFGIGGLLRFRTVVGEAKDTGRVILVTVVGLCCGLKIFVAAVLATLIGWVLIWYLESQNAGRIVVKGLKDSDILAAAETYRGILGEAGCAVIRERKNLTKGRVTFIVKTPPELDAEALEEAFANVPEEQRGVVDWEIS